MQVERRLSRTPEIPANGFAVKEDKMSRFGKLFRAAATAAFMVAGIAPANAQYPSGYVPAGGSVPTANPYFAPPAGSYASQGFESPDFLYAGIRRHSAPGCAQPGCDQPCPPPGTVTPPGMTPPVSAPSAELPSFDFGARGGPTVGLGGYIDNAVPATQFRLRYDSAYDSNRPDRGGFFYAQCGCFQSPGAIGPPLPERRVDFQELNAYMEYAFTPRFSLFANIPVRFINPDQNRNAAGLGDMSFGGKLAILATEQRILTAQLRVITPTGEATDGLGTGVTWLEPGLLFQQQLSDRWQLFGQLKDQLYLERLSDFNGNLLTYGLGTSYVVANGCWGYVAPVGEVVGWTVLGGQQLNPDAGVAESADGDTIVNAKIGLRIGFGASELGKPFPSKSDLYIGYGRALTGDVWYKDMFRIEFRRFF